MKFVISFLFLFSSLSEGANYWKGLKIQPEKRCSPYNKKKDYKYSQSLEKKLIKKYGKIYGPYTKRVFDNPKQTDIEHIVATNEAHDSGLCSAEVKIRKAFANDLLNLTLAGSKVNRHQKSGKDAGEWLPPKNKCWFVNTIIRVKKKYNLSIDINEKKALKKVYDRCTDFEMELLEV